MYFKCEIWHILTYAHNHETITTMKKINLSITCKSYLLSPLVPPSCLRQPLIYFLSLCIHCPFLESSINGILHHVLFFLATLLLHNIIILRFVPIVASANKLYFLLQSSIPLCCAPQYLYVLTCPWDILYCLQSLVMTQTCYEHSWTSLCMNISHCFSWANN